MFIDPDIEYKLREASVLLRCTSDTIGDLRYSGKDDEVEMCRREALVRCEVMMHDVLACVTEILYDSTVDEQLPVEETTNGKH